MEILSFRAEPAQEGQEEKRRGEDLQHKSPKENLFPLGSGVTKRSGIEVPEILIVLYSYFFSFWSCCFTIFKAFQLAFLI